MASKGKRKGGGGRGPRQASLLIPSPPTATPVQHRLASCPCPALRPTSLRPPSSRRRSTRGRRNWPSLARSSSSPPVSGSGSCRTACADAEVKSSPVKQKERGEGEETHEVLGGLCGAQSDCERNELAVLERSESYILVLSLARHAAVEGDVEDEAKDALGAHDWRQGKVQARQCLVLGREAGERTHSVEARQRTSRR